MRHTRRGTSQRTVAALALLILGVATMMFGFTSTASATPPHAATDHCANHESSSKTVGTADQYLTVNGTQVWLDITGNTVSFYAADKTTPISVSYCIKASVGESGPRSGTSGSVNWLNPGEQTPDISYVVVYSVSTPTTPASTPTTPVSTPTTPVSTPTTPIETLPTQASTPTTPIETLPTQGTNPNKPNNPGNPNNPNNPGGSEPEVLGIEANAPAAAPAAAPTAVDAGLTAQESGSATPWILAGVALALAGLVLGFSPAAPRGKRTI